jgi:RHS repeat-associated protein
MPRSTRKKSKTGTCHVMSIQNEYGNTRRTTTDLYIDGLILRDGKPLMWQFDGGYVDLDDNGSPTGWNYYVTDHLGSTRKVVGSDNTVRETISYYPFGSEMTMQDPAQMTGDFQHPYRFTGKELDRLNGLNMYDFGARWYDVAGVPMWTSVDPLAEKYYNVSPYNYCMNNPVILVDPDGRFPSMWKAMLNHKLSEMEAKFTGSVVGDIVYDRNARTKNGRYYYNKVSSDGEGGFVVTKITKMNREFADDVSTIGIGIECVGYGMTISVIGAEAGVPTAKVGAAISTAGTFTGAAIDLFNEDYANILESFIFYGTNRKLGKLIEKIPGCEDYAKNVLKQGTDLKMSLVKYIYDATTDKHQDGQTNKEGRE